MKLLYTFCSVRAAEVELLVVLILFVGGGEVDCSGFTKVDNTTEDFEIVWVFSNVTTGDDTFCSEPLATLEDEEVPASPTGVPGTDILGNCVLLDKTGKVEVLGVDWLTGLRPLSSEDKLEFTLWHLSLFVDELCCLSFVLSLRWLLDPLFTLLTVEVVLVKVVVLLVLDVLECLPENIK